MSQEINTHYNQGIQWFTVSLLSWAAIDRWCLLVLTKNGLPMAIGLSILSLSLVAVLRIIRCSEKPETSSPEEDKVSLHPLGFAVLGVVFALPFTVMVYFALQHVHNPTLPLYLKGLAILSINGMGMGLARLWQTYVLSRQFLLMQGMAP